LYSQPVLSGLDCVRSDALGPWSVRRKKLSAWNEINGSWDFLSISIAVGFGIFFVYKVFFSDAYPPKQKTLEVRPDETPEQYLSNSEPKKSSQWSDERWQQWSDEERQKVWQKRINEKE
jgi:hypothetical protein